MTTNLIRTLTQCLLLTYSVPLTHAEQEDIAPTQQKFILPASISPMMVIVGSTHAWVSTLPLSLIENLGYFMKLGLTHLVLEVRPNHPYATELTTHLQKSPEDLSSGTKLDRWSEDRKGRRTLRNKASKSELHCGARLDCEKRRPWTLPIFQAFTLKQTECEVPFGSPSV